MAAAAPLLWLRAETKPNEHRSALVPSVVKELVAAGSLCLAIGSQLTSSPPPFF